MSNFPRTKIGDLSVSRLMIGTNWFLGFSHTSKAKDRLIKETMTREAIADIVEVFLKAGVDTLYGVRNDQHLLDAISDAEQRSGRKCITLTTPIYPLKGSEIDLGEAERLLDEAVEMGASICMPHQATTDAFVDRRTKSITGLEDVMRMTRERGMVTGLSTHMPETPGYADASGLDVDTYMQIYNAAGFLMQIEIDWVQRAIWSAKKPVITIKPLAAGKLPPLVGLNFVWNTIRDCDMVCIGTYTPGEAEEAIELSYAALERRLPVMELQKTRSKASLSCVNSK